MFFVIYYYPCSDSVDDAIAHRGIHSDVEWLPHTVGVET